MPTPCKLPLTDPELLHALECGRSLAQIAQEHGVTEQAVQSRLGQLRRRLAAPAVHQAEETVAAPFDCFAELHKNHAVLDQLREACLRLPPTPSLPHPPPVSAPPATIASGGARPSHSPRRKVARTPEHLNT